MRESLQLIAALVAAAGGANTPRSLARAVAGVLAADKLASRCHLSYVAVGSAAVALRDDEWHHVEPDAGVGQVVVPGLVVRARGVLPAFFSDPSFIDVLTGVIASALEHLEVVHRVAQLSQRAHVEAKELRGDLSRLADAPTIVARSTAMRDVLARAALVAKHTTTVLITGESGTGKEVIAHEI